MAGPYPKRDVVCPQCGVVRSAVSRVGNVRLCRTCAHKQPNAGQYRARHGGTGTNLHKKWQSMRARCAPAGAGKSAQWYSARGIEVCEEWRSFSAFRDWALANGYSPGLEIDRIDNGRGYSPSNCRWVDAKTNARNRRNNRLVTAFGRTQCVNAWAEETGIGRSTIAWRLDRGIPPEQALTMPTKR